MRKYLWKYNKMRQNVDVLVLQLLSITCRLLSLTLLNLVQSLFLYEKFQLFEDSKPSWESHCAWLKQMHLAGDISEGNETY